VSCSRFIGSVEADHAVALSCAVLRVSRSGFYAWRHREQLRERTGAASARARADAALTERIVQIHRESRGTYGSPRVHAELVDPDGPHRVRCSRKRVERLMRQAGLRGCERGRRRVRTTVADPAATPAKDLVERAFAPAAVGAPNRLWVADISYVPTGEGWLYLAVVLDCFSRHQRRARHSRHRPRARQHPLDCGGPRRPRASHKPARERHNCLSAPPPFPGRGETQTVASTLLPAYAGAWCTCAPSSISIS